MRTIFTDVVARQVPSGAVSEWVLIESGRVLGTGTGEAPRADRTISLDGATLLPAFTDAHVHLPATGLYELGLDFRDTHRTEDILSAFKVRASGGDGVLFGGNFEDPLDEPLDRHLLDRAVGDKAALLARADMHSCVVSSSLLEHLDLTRLEGVDRDETGQPTGYLREQAAAQAWTWFDTNLPRDEAASAIGAAVQLAYSKGVACVHEMHIVEWRGWATFEVLRETLSDRSLVVVPYIASSDVDRVTGMGFHRIGGDYFLDGSFGSHTAWLTEPYAVDPPAGSPAGGISYRDDEGLLDFFTRAQNADLQVGVHAIGDAAIEQAIRTWERVADAIGLEDVRRKGHRIEHFECASDDQIFRAARLGLRASVQPAFDRLWGGPDGLYSSRIGPRRAAQMNRFGSMNAAGLLLGAGSDSTVTPLDPFLQMASLRSHHVADESLDALTALTIHTIGSRAMAFGRTLDGTLEPGAVADLVAVDRDPITSTTEELLETSVLGTWIGGNRVWPTDEAEAL